MKWIQLEIPYTFDDVIYPLYWYHNLPRYISFSCKVLEGVFPACA